MCSSRSPRGGLGKLPGHPRRINLADCGVSERAVIRAARRDPVGVGGEDCRLGCRIVGALRGFHDETARMLRPLRGNPQIDLRRLLDGLDAERIFAVVDVSFSVPNGGMKILLGASGSGKSVVLKLILGLFRPDTGTILVNGQRVDRMTERDLMRVRSDIGMLFQESALFDSLTVAANVGYRLYEETDMPADEVRGRIEEVLGFIGLGEYFAAKPNLLLFDDPTTGLDPVAAAAKAGQTTFMVLHQGRIYFEGTAAALRASQDAYLQEFLFMTLPPW
jgi:phospholipid/cholesterol/gamma-HCH transport system ATP-binding protein